MATKPHLVSDEELACQTQAGSSEAFEQLIFRYEKRLYVFALQSCRHPVDAREITQDTFVRASQNILRFDARRSFGAWLFTIARRLCIDRHRAGPLKDENKLPELADENDPAEVLAQREDSQNLWRIARHHLTETQFQTVWLHYAEDMNVAQIAQVLGKTVVHIKVVLFRARQVLSQKLIPRPPLLQTAAATEARRGLLQTISTK